jgi:hypothetical protein
LKIRNQPAPVLDSQLEAELLEGIGHEALPAARKAAMFRRIFSSIAGDGTDFITVHHGEGEWRRVAPRILEKRLVDVPGTYVCILRLEAGAILPPHDHASAEESVVLEGEVWLGDVFCRAGDFHYAPRGRRHGAIRTDTGCLLYVRSGGRLGAPLL